MKNILFSICFLLISSIVYGQSYFTSAGLRVGNGFGITVKQRLLKKVTAEGIIGANNNTTSITGLVEFHQPVLTRYFNIYGGGGFHTYFPNNSNVSGGVGLDLIAGLECNISKLNISVDYKPSINFSGSNNFLEGGVALSLRYIIINDKVFKEKHKAKQKEKRKAKRKEFFKGLGKD
jgi:hypothetical protein